MRVVKIRRHGSLFWNLWCAELWEQGSVIRRSRVHRLSSAFRAARWYMGRYKAPIEYKDRIVQRALFYPDDDAPLGSL